ncbi:chitin binding domain-containing protein [Xylariaceae sp. FL1272]|nr:chitin binding domain-containing protein [Xylariaceae sp. FL1272]
MKSTSSVVVGFASFASTVLGHGFVTSPQARMPGTAMAAACGNQVEVNQASDNYGNIQGMLQVAAGQTDYDEAACDIWLCKGYKLDDNTDNVQAYTAGQVVPMTVDIRAPHDGVANVSIVSTSTNTVIGSPLISWDEYGYTSYTIPANETSFSITIPSDLGSECATAGACVIQWFWDARSIDQTYESCIDFTVDGSGAGDSSSASSSSQSAATTSSATSAAATTTSAAQITSSVAAVATTTPVVTTSIPVASSTTSTVATTSIPVASSTTSIPVASSTAVPTRSPCGMKKRHAKRHARDFKRA